MDTTLNRYSIFTKMICIGKSMRLYCHKAIEKEGFSLIETDVLLSLAAGNSTVKDISAWSNITKGNTSTAVESLRKKELVSVSTDSKDRRRATVTLTENALRVLERLRSAEEEFFSNFMVALPKKDASLVDRIFESMQKLSLPSFLEKISKKEKRHEKD